ncbi:hypothetical protein HDV01_001292 [Terramyces sp. JEL0728]|nr:hypothetical protein HDV01_001292 [Terramyces sp. JEL0728]
MAKKYMRDKIREKYNLSKSHEITQMAAACWAIETEETKAKFLNISKDLYKKYKESQLFMNMEHVQTKAINPELCMDEFEKNGQRKLSAIKMPNLLPQLKRGGLEPQGSYPPRIDTRFDHSSLDNRRDKPRMDNRTEFPPRIDTRVDYPRNDYARYDTDYPSYRDYPPRNTFEYIPERFQPLQSPSEIRSSAKNNLDSLLNPIRHFGVEPAYSREMEFNQDISPPDSPLGSPELVANLPGAGVHSFQSVPRETFPESSRPSVDIYALFM